MEKAAAVNLLKLFPDLLQCIFWKSCSKVQRIDAVWTTSAILCRGFLSLLARQVRTCDNS
jgi:hypothetical protein